MLTMHEHVNTHTTIRIEAKLSRHNTLCECSNDVPLSLLVPTVEGTDCEGVVCPQDQSRAAVVLTGADHLVTGTGGGVRVH